MISVIIPIYNTEKYLKRCVDSVLNSSYGELEVFLVDDGSTDGSLQICRKYAQRDSRVQVIAQKHQGVSAARNQGIWKSKGEWILFLDSDDFISHDFLELVARKEFEDQDLLIFDYTSTSQWGDPWFSLKTYGKADNLRLVEKLLRSQQLTRKGHTDLRSPCVKAYRRRIIEQYHLRFPLELSIGEDQIFHIEYQMRVNHCTYIQKAVYFVGTRPDSTTRLFQTELMASRQLFVKRLKQVLEKHGCFAILEKAYYDTVLDNMKGILVMGIFHPESPRTRQENHKLCKSMQEVFLFKKAVEMYNGKTGELSRRILLFFFHRGCFGITEGICRLGHIRIRWKKR